MTNLERGIFDHCLMFRLWYPYAIIQMCSVRGIGSQYELPVV